MDGRRRASECVDHDDPRPPGSQGSKREVSPGMFGRSGKQPPWETRKDPVPVRRRAKVQAEAITHAHGDVLAGIGKVKRRLGSLTYGGTRVPAGHGRNEDRRG
jgi:hypothetical protein